MTELVDLYNVDRELMGARIPRNTSIPEGTYILIVHICIFSRAGEMLIQKRTEEKSIWPGYWDLSAGGAACAGESSREAAARETFEELGIRLPFDAKRPVITVNFARGFDDIYTLDHEPDIDELNLQTDELSEVKWASYHDICTLIDSGKFIPYEKELIKYLFAAREGRGSWNL